MASKRERAEAAERTLELKVDNMSFLLEQLGRDCAPDQLVRELTVNAIQAIQATGGGGVVVWDQDPVFTRRFGARKLAVVDTGTGMSGPEMVRYINHLASSGRIQSEDGNFGVGAKIAAATRNPAGLVYLSWRGGEGSMVWFWKHPETGRYGLKELPLPDGGHGYWAPVDEERRPVHIAEHGTVVVLLGRDVDDDTTLPPEDAGGEDARALWLTRYLNTRFFTFPEGIDVRVRERWGTPASRVRPVRGMRHFLEAVARDAGTVDLGDARAHWWILPEEVSGEWAERHVAHGHVGALFQDELYELYTGRSGTAKLQSFGIAVGHHRVVLYVEPKVRGRRRVGANTARTALLVNGRPLPWGEWAEAFRERMPQAILDLMDEVAGARDARSRTESFKERMKSLANLLYIGGAADENLLRLFAADRGRGDAAADRSRSADAEAAPGDADAAHGVEAAAEEEGAEADAGTRDVADRDAGDPAAGCAAEGDAAAAFGPSSEPGARPRSKPLELDLDRLLDLEVVWVPESECGATARAAHYIPETNTLLMNRDFRVFREYVDRWRAQYEGNPAAQREVEELVREWLEQPLRELIIRSHFLRGSEGWSDEHIRQLLSDEALTAVSLPCYLTEMRLRTAVARRLGKLRPAA